MTTQNINMDLIPGGNTKVIHVSQYDHESRTYKITLTHNNKNDFTIPEGVTVEVRGTKPSGKSFVYPCTFEGNVVTLVIKDQMTAEHGTVKAELVLVKGTTRLGAGNFEIIVEKASFTPDNIISSDTFDSLVEDAVVKCANENLIELYVDVELNPESDAPVGNKVICNNFANAIKGYAYGATINVDDVSSIEHNPSIWVHGTNIIPLPYYHGHNITQQGVNITVDESGVITFNGTALADSAFRLINKASIRVKGRYTLSGCLGGSNTTYYLQPFINDKGVGTVRNGAITYEWDGYLTSLAFFFKAGTVFENVQFRPQLEKGDVATGYTPWVNPTTVTLTDGNGKTHVPNEDGVVEDVISTSPIMTLSTNDADFIIECEYNRDSTKVIEKLTNAIIALGGSV